MSVVLYQENNLFIGIIIQGNKLIWGEKVPSYFSLPKMSLSFLISWLSVFQTVGWRAESSLSFSPQHDASLEEDGGSCAAQTGVF